MRRKIISISLPPQLATEARIQAAKLDKSRSNLISEAVKKYLAELQASQVNSNFKRRGDE